MKRKITAVLLVAALVLSFGLVPVSPVMAVTITVPDVYGTIQEAIDAAGQDDTIMVKTGTYTEDLTIPAGKNNLELKPYGSDVVTIKGVQMSLSTAWPAALPNIKILSDGVKIHGFTIQGPDVNAGYYSSGVVIGGTNVEIYDNHFQVTNAGSLDDVSQAIQTYHELAVPGVDISGLSIHKNTFTNHGSGIAGYEAIYINRDTGTGEVKIEDNKFTGDVLRAITTERSNTTISGNTIITDLAPGLPGGYVGILVRDYSAGTQDAVMVTGNIVKGSEEGKGFLTGILIGTSGQSLTNIEVACNTVEMNDVGIKVRSSANGVVVNCNNIMHNITYGVENIDDVNDLDATKNWWGDVSGPSGEGMGTGDAVSTYVTFDPWSLTPDPCEPKSMGFWKNHPESVDALLGEYGPGNIGLFEVADSEDTAVVFRNASAKYAENMLAAQFLAAALNAVHLVHLGIDICPDVVEAMVAADVALASYNGPDSLKIKGKNKHDMLEISEVLDSFNNGELCEGLCEW